jgi:hypothetical protein
MSMAKNSLFLAERVNRRSLGNHLARGEIKELEQRSRCGCHSDFGLAGNHEHLQIDESLSSSNMAAKFSPCGLAALPTLVAGGLLTPS